MMTTKKIKLNTWGRNYVVVSASQGEVDSRFLEITLVDETGDMTLTDREVVLYAIKPDGNVIFNNCTIEDASRLIVSVELTSQMSSTQGVMACELHIIGPSTEILKIIGLEIVISNCSDISESVESTSEFTCLSEALVEVETLKDEYQTLIDSPLTYNYLGVCPVSYGGTGATTASGARTNLELVTESGTWTPTLGASTTNPTVTYGYQYGYYYVIGNLVYITCKISGSITEAGSGGARINGLPYTSIGTHQSALSRRTNTAISSTDVTGWVQTNNTYIPVTDAEGNASVVWTTGTGKAIGFSGCYIKA